MKNYERSIRRFVCILTLCIMGSVLCAQTDNLMLTYSIQQADQQTLVEMAHLRGLDTSLSTMELRKSLLAYHNLTVDQLTLSPEAGMRYRMHIEQADSMTSDSQSSLVELKGNVVIAFETEEGKRIRLLAQRVMIDLERTLLSAEGNVRYEDGETTENLQTVEGTVVTLDWEESTLYVRGAVTRSEKTNSENQTISLFTSGSSITLDQKTNSMVFADGWIGTQEKDPLSSIRAKRLMFLPGGDLMLNHAALYLGRVPVFYTPFFLIPGNRMTGNPSMGFNSERGMFVSTSWELFGNNPSVGKSDENGSFAALLVASQQAAGHPDGPIYTSKPVPTDFQSWASKSGSYLTLYLDAYEKVGVYAAIAANIGLANKKLKIGGTLAFALHPDGQKVISGYSRFPIFRYWGDPSLVLDTTNIDIRIEFPFSSDPSAKRLYANRLTNFTFDSVLGSEQKFPTDFSSDLTSYTWKLEGSASIPLPSLSPYVKNFRISTLKAQANWEWRNTNGLYSYQLRQVLLPDLQTSLSGTLLNLASDASTKAGETRSTSLSLPSLVPAAFVHSRPMPRRTSQTKRYLTLDYTFDERLTHTLSEKSTANQLDIAYLYSYTKGTFTLSASPHSSYFVFSQQLVPQLTIVNDESKSVFVNQEMQLYSVTKASIPLIGLSYNLSQRLYRLQLTKTRKPDDSIEETTKEDGYEFTKDAVSVHSLVLENSFSFRFGTFTPSITTTLAPLKLSFVPKLSYRTGDFTISLSHRWSDKNGRLEKDKLSGSFRYSPSFFNFQIDMEYATSAVPNRSLDALSFKQRLDFSLFNKSVKFNQLLSYEGTNSKQVHDWVDALQFKVEVPYVSFDYVLQGTLSDLKPLSMGTQVKLADNSFKFWKNRIVISYGLDATLKFNFQDRYASRFDITASLGFSIAEFVNMKFAVQSSNNGFSRYYDGNGDFSFLMLWEDLLRSLDFFGDGRYRTQFNLSSISFDLVHYLGDWSLNCKYTGSIVLSNNQYNWVPTVSVFLSWNTLPELSVQETWTESNDMWVRSVN